MSGSHVLHVALDLVEDLTTCTELEILHTQVTRDRRLKPGTMMNFLSEMLPRMCISSKANSFSEDHKDSKGLASEKIKVQPQARPRPLARTSKKHVRRQRALAANTEQDVRPPDPQPWSESASWILSECARLCC